MQNPACELRRIPIPRTRMNIGVAHTVGLYLLDPLNLVCLLAPPAAGRLVAHPLPLLEATKPHALYAGVVHEDLLAALVGLYEAVAFLFGKPLHRSPGHDALSAPLLGAIPEKGEARRFRAELRNAFCSCGTGPRLA